MVKTRFGASSVSFVLVVDAVLFVVFSVLLLVTVDEVVTLALFFAFCSASNFFSFAFLLASSAANSAFIASLIRWRRIIFLFSFSFISAVSLLSSFLSFEKFCSFNALSFSRFSFS